MAETVLEAAMPKLPAASVAELPHRTRPRRKREEARAVVAAYEASGLSLEKFAPRGGSNQSASSGGRAS